MRQQSEQDLATIRKIMEQNARFLSLSGWSGVWAGAVALAGEGLAWRWWENNIVARDLASDYISSQLYHIRFPFLILALATLVVAIIGGIYFTWRKSKADMATLWNPISKKMLAALLIPLLAGGVYVMSLLWNGHLAYVVPGCLLFYGLSLLNASKYTYTDIRYLGLTELVLGCIALLWPTYAPLFWALGFGICHILYGLLMSLKYEK